MIGKSIIGIMIIAAIMVIGFTAYGSAHNSANQTPVQNLSNNSNSSKNNSNNEPTNTTTTNQNTGSGTQLISAADAQNIAKQYILQPGAQAGTPNLKETVRKSTSYQLLWMVKMLEK